MKETPLAVIKETIERAKLIANYWRHSSTAERVARLILLKKAIKNNFEEIAAVITRETRKPLLEAYGDEIAVILRLIDFWIENAEKVLVEKVSASLTEKLLLPGKQCEIWHEPRGSGLVLVMSPWNVPFQLALGDCVEVTVSGNVAILKPSEKTPETNTLIKKIIKEAGWEDLILVIEGAVKTVQNVISALPPESHITFTGSSGVGQLIRRLGEQHNHFVHIEGGGADKLLILLRPDSPKSLIRRAVNAAVMARFRNRGHNCNAAKEIIIVTRNQAWANEFARMIAQKALELRANVDMGPLFSQEQLLLAKRQLKDALDKGAECLTRNEKDALGATEYFPPIVLVNIKNDMLVLTEETFCPILPVRSIENISRAISLINNSPYALDVYVFTENKEEFKWLARRLNVGSVVMNDALVNYALVGLPFGGEKESGGSRKHGIEGIRRYTKPKAITVATKLPKIENHWPPYDGKVKPLPLALIMKLLGGSEKKDVLRWAIKNLI